MLEQQLQTLTHAISKLTDAVHDVTVLLNMRGAIGSPIEAPHTETLPENQGFNAQQAPEAHEIIGIGGPELQAEVDAENEPLTYDDVKKATIALSAKSKAEAVKLLADYGVRKATELPQDAWAAYVAEAQILAA